MTATELPGCFRQPGKDKVNQMRKRTKTALSIVLCLIMIFGIMGSTAMALNAEDYTNVPYHCYTYLGDSISWGYGLHEDIDRTDKFSVGRRVPGSYTDLVGSVLEKNNNATVYPATCSGARISDYRFLLEQGMGLENPYVKSKDWYGERHPERTEQLLQMGPQICEEVRKSDLITIQAGINDITATIVNAASATGLVDLVKLQEISGVEGVLDYVAFALENVMQNPNIVGSFTDTFLQEAGGIRENIEAVVDHLVAVAPKDADILILGYHQATSGLRVIPGSGYSLIFDLIDRGIDLFNNIYRDAAAKYDNVTYVDVPDATSIFSAGTTVIDALDVPGIISRISSGEGAVDSVTKNILKGLHPDAAGHEYMAERVMDTLRELNGGTSGDDTGMPFTDVHSGDWFCPYVKYVYENGLFSGTSETTFEPNAAMTRGMFVTVLWAKEGKPEAGNSSFKDLGADWYKKAVAWAASNSIVGGYSSDSFGPEDPISREQMACMMHQFARYKGYDVSENGDLTRFHDAQSVSSYAESAMKWATGHGVISGTDQGLEPKGTATRAQVAAVMQAFDTSFK